MAKAFLGLSGLYATKLRYGGHESSVAVPGICGFPTGSDDNHLARIWFSGVLGGFSGFNCYIDLSIFTE
jgi:hypothetical protein